MRLRNAVVAVVVAVAPLAACGSGDDEPAADGDDITTTTEDDGGGTDAGDVGGDTDGDGGGGDGDGGGSAPGSDRPESVRADFRIPFPSGWEVDLLGEIGMTETSGAQLLYSLDAYDDVVAFYDEWFASQPEEYNRSEQSSGFIIYQQLGDLFYQVSIAPDHEERGQTYVALQVSGGNDAN